MKADPGRTAIRRTDYSRPVRAAIAGGVLTTGRSFFDFGCGHGDDLKRLEANGFQVAGWDPAHRPDSPQNQADVVNLGYVVNVIERETDRARVLRAAWSLAHRVLIVSARLASDRGKLPGARSVSDGELTSRGTFQRFFTQAELREWVESVLESEAVPACPGVFLVFKHEDERQEYVASRFRTRRVGPRLRECDVLFDEHKDIVRELSDFYEAHGRVPLESELPDVVRIRTAFGTAKRAFLVIRRVTGSERWQAAADRRREDLAVFLGLERFGGRPRMGELAPSLQRDVRALFGSYRKACQEADSLLFSAGDLEAVGRAIDGCSIGKKTRAALYVHRSALAKLPILLKVYEGCARRYYGDVEDANIIKLNRLIPKISYLEYPDFDKKGHPTLARSHSVALRSFDTRVRDFRNSANPPVLHRKELLVEKSYPLYRLFRQLSEAEARAGLLTEGRRIGLLRDWEDALDNSRHIVRGNRLLRRAHSAPT